MTEDPVMFVGSIVLLTMKESMILLSKSDEFCALEFVSDELKPSTFLTVLFVRFNSVRFEAKTEEFTRFPRTSVVLMMIPSRNEALITVELKVTLYV